MTKKKVRKLYSRKLEDEMDEFISGMKKLKKEEIMACAYRIYIMHSIYEYMLDVQDELSKNELKKIVEQSSIISDLYWKWIKSDISDYDNEAMREGRDLEDYVAKRFTDETGKKVRKAIYMYIDEDYPFMFADVDRLIVGENAALECKTVNAYNADKWADGKIPPHYKIQCYHYMSVLGLDCMYIAALVLGKEFIWRKIERDDELINNLRCIEQAFWENNVLAGVMPDPDGSSSASSWIKDRFPEAKEGTSITLTGFDEKLKRRSEVSKLLDKLKKEKEQIEQEVKMFLGDMEEARNNHFKVMWKNVISSRLDTTRLKNENPDIYNQYVVDNVSRRFTIREV